MLQGAEEVVKSRQKKDKKREGGEVTGGGGRRDEVHVTLTEEKKILRSRTRTSQRIPAHWGFQETKNRRAVRTER